MASPCAAISPARALSRETKNPLLATNDVAHARPRAAPARRCRRLHPRRREDRRRRAPAGSQCRAPSEGRRAKWRGCFAKRREALEETICFLDGLTSASTNSSTIIPRNCARATPRRSKRWRPSPGKARAPDIPTASRATIVQTLAHELALIARLEYAPYFLTVHDIVRYARSQGILCQGRGSAANSAVCYCLGITEVDPSQTTFCSSASSRADRGEPPDIDVDFEHERREEVMQYIYRALRARSGRVCRRRHHLSHPFGDPRSRQDLRPFGGSHRAL